MHSNVTEKPLNAPQLDPIARHSVAVIGGGQAGLSISWYPKRAGIDHVVFEKERAGHAWRAERRGTVFLVTPHWQCPLPGFPYQGDDPHGFMVRHEIVDYMDGFVASFGPPLREGVMVKSLKRNPHQGFTLETSDGVHVGRLQREAVVRIALEAFDHDTFAQRRPEGGDEAVHVIDDLVANHETVGIVALVGKAR